MQDHLRAISIFQAVAEAGSFSRAAKRLGLSPSVISHHVSALEDHLGLALFYRTTRRISLTDAGAELLDAGREMTAAAERGLQAMQRRRDQPVGRLRITCPASWEQPPLVDTFIDFCAAYPGIETTVNFTMQYVDLAGSAFDLAIRGSARPLDDSTYKARAIAGSPAVACAAPGYLATRPPARTLGDVADWDWIRFPDISWAQLLADTGEDVPQPRIAFACDSHEAARRAALAGLGFAFLDGVLARPDLEAGRLVRVLPDANLPVVTMWAIWPANAGPDSPAHRFVDFAVPRWRRIVAT